MSYTDLVRKQDQIIMSFNVGDVRGTCVHLTQGSHRAVLMDVIYR